MKTQRALVLAGLVVVLAACSPSASSTASEPGSEPSIVVPSVSESLALTVVETTAGAALAGGSGLTLYINTEEAGGTIVCVDACEANWPPLAAPVDAGAADASLLGTVTRPDGSEQTTYNGFPLYYFAGDSAEGDAMGEGLNGVWFIADPAGN